MIDEPQTLVWFPTLHRLAMSETGMHQGFSTNMRATGINVLSTVNQLSRLHTAGANLVHFRTDAHL